ncbi:type IV secretion system protein [Limnohabitans lacus]|jgi:type IV secretion system protein VirB5|uniref:Type IV secretion system protein n=1 Tax=Limnohabitans lacus TaxID=3045173 RepID=A0ABT6XAP1_9BURK|nr:type IV secretion system protein [Limnohabitans sp. HM2-2]MDI9235175.1 type IV secretion system protein [Limnohabitans sp. HM2-2]
MKPNLKLTHAILALSITTSAFSQGIPVIDVAAIVQAIEQVRAWEGQYQQMMQSLQQQQQLIQNTTGSRQLGQVSNAITSTVLPPDIVRQLTTTRTHDELNSLALQNFGALSQAMQTRASQIQELMRQINSTQDAKSIQELTARIQSEQVMATNEAKEAQWLRTQIEMQAQALDLAHKQRMLGNLRTNPTSTR